MQISAGKYRKRRSTHLAVRWLVGALLAGSVFGVSAKDLTPETVDSLKLSDVLAGRLSTSFQPEYDRHLDRVMMSVHNSIEKEWFETNLRTLDLLPKYSSVLLLVHQNSSEATVGLSQAAVDARLGTESRIVRSGIKERWAQDIGEGGGGGFMLGWKGQEVVRDLEELGIPAHRHFLPLDGGNVQLARNRAGRRFVVLGSEEFSCGVDTLPDSDSAGSRFDQTREVYRRTFGADEVLVLPNLAHAHIDQTVFFVADGVAVTEIMPEPTDADRRLMVNFQVEWANASSSGTTFKVALYPAGYSGETRHVTSNWTTGTHGEAIPELFMTAEQREVFLRYQAVCPHLNDLVHTDRVRKNRVATERLLVDRGFEIVHLKTSVWHEFNCQNYVNAMPFRNRETGRPGVLLPVYRHPGAPSEPVDLDDLRGLNRENVDILRAHGFDVVAVPSHVQLGGNLHCSILQF